MSDRLVEQLTSKIADYTPDVEVTEIGRVIEIADGIAHISGLTECRASEILEFPGGVKGIALNLESGTVGAIIMGEYAHIKEGDIVKRTDTILSVPVSDDLIGRVVDPLMNPIDDGAPVSADDTYIVDKKAPGVMSRQPVSEPLQTGITAIDSMIPIGRGQRELIIGDRQTGKTAVALDTIINQKGEGVHCVYVAIGQKRAKVARIVAQLKEAGAMEYTTIVLAGASDAAAMKYIAPYSATALAEYFMDKKRDVLVVYDDLSKHAVAYREISLLLRRPPGREAYPGDVFYLHSRLLERACRRNEAHGGGSITALPIIETQAGDISAYIPTNVISITDGQIYLEAGIFNKGIRPAINLGASVSRVGSSAQITSMKKVAGTLKLQMAQYRELEAFAQFSSDLDAATKEKLDRGERIQELLKQPQFAPVDTAVQVGMMYAANNGHLDGIAVENIARWKEEFTDFMTSSKGALLDRLRTQYTDAEKRDLAAAVEQFSRKFG